MSAGNSTTELILRNLDKIRNGSKDLDREFLDLIFQLGLINPFAYCDLIKKNAPSHLYEKILTKEHLLLRRVRPKLRPPLQ